MANYGELVLRILLSFGIVFLVTRILGKKTMTQLTPFDLITTITMGAIGAILAADLRIDWRYPFLAIVGYGLLTLVLGLVTLESRYARKLLVGEPVVVVHGGKILEENMAKVRYNLDDLTQQLREKDVFDLAEVEFAILEPNGSLSVQKKSQFRPVQPADLKLNTAYQGISSELIVDGQVISQNLEQNNLDKKWLLDQLAKEGIGEVSEVSFASLDTSGKLYIDKADDNLKKENDITD